MYDTVNGRESGDAEERDFFYSLYQHFDREPASSFYLSHVLLFELSLKAADLDLPMKQQTQSCGVALFYLGPRR